MPSLGAPFNLSSSYRITQLPRSNSLKGHEPRHSPHTGFELGLGIGLKLELELGLGLGLGLGLRLGLGLGVRVRVLRLGLVRHV